MPYRIEGKRIVFETPDWCGTLALDSTGNLIRLRHRRTEMEIFRFPVPEKELAEYPAVFGMPLLLPPNRIRDGRFSAGGHDFRFPINEPATTCFLHGVLLGRPFKLEEVEENSSVLRFRVSCAFPDGERRFPGFPCEFTAEIVYELTAGALSHRLTVRNRGRAAMPLGVGFHTAFCTPESEKIRLEIPADSRGAWEVDPLRRLPSGRRRPWSEREKRLFAGEETIGPFPVSVQFPLPDAAHTVRIHRANGVVRYDLDPRFLHLACWNDGGGRNFFCIEPMSWMTDAPNLPLPAPVSGFSLLPPESERTFCCTLRVEDVV